MASGQRPYTCATCGTIYDLSGVPQGFAAACPNCRTPAVDAGGKGGTRSAMIGGGVLLAGVALTGICLMLGVTHAIEGAWVGRMIRAGERTPSALSLIFEGSGEKTFRGTATVGIVTEPTVPILQMLEGEVRDGQIDGNGVRFTLQYDGSFGHNEEISFEGKFTDKGDKIEGTWSATGGGGSGTFSLQTAESGAGGEAPAAATGPEGRRVEERPREVTVERADPGSRDAAPAPVGGGYNPGGKFRFSYGLGVVLDGQCRVLLVEPGSPAEGFGVAVGMQLALDERAGTWDFNRSAFEWMADQNGPGTPVQLYRYSGDFGDGTNFVVGRVELR